MLSLQVIVALMRRPSLVFNRGIPPSADPVLLIVRQRPSNLTNRLSISIWSLGELTSVLIESLADFGSSAGEHPMVREQKLNPM